MHRQRLPQTPFIVAMVIVSIALLPSCGRTPEEPTAVAPAGDGAEIDYTVLALPQNNPEIGISLNAVPVGLVATFNEERAVEITDANRPSLRYTFDADLPGMPARSPKTVEEFGVFMGKFSGGKLDDSGEIDTALGDATWASGFYSAEDEVFEDVRVFLPHPSKPGTLILSAVCPKGVATVRERLATMREILSNVS